MGHIFKKRQMDLVYHLRYTKERRWVPESEFAKLNSLTYLVSRHQGPTEIFHMLRLVGTTQQRIMMDSLVVSSVFIQVT